MGRQRIQQLMQQMRDLNDRVDQFGQLVSSCDAEAQRLKSGVDELTQSLNDTQQRVDTGPQ